MQAYALDPKLWGKNRIRLIVIQVMTWGGGVLVGLFISFLQIRSRSLDLNDWLYSVARYLVVYSVVAASFTMLKIRKAKRRYQSYELTMTDESIGRKQYKMSTIELKREEITRIQSVEGKGLMVKTADPINMLWVPDELNGYEQVVATLSQWVPVEAPRTTLPLLYNAKAGVVISGLSMLALYLVSNPVAVTCVAIPYLAFLIYVGLHALRSPNSGDSALKVGGSVVLVVVFIVMRVMAVWR